MKKINVMLQTSFGKIQIGEISLNPSIIGSVSEEYVVEQWLESLNVNIEQIARVWTQAEHRVYLYGIHGKAKDSEIYGNYEFYYVSSGMLYDKQEYFSEIEVGEYLGDLTTLDQITALDTFFVKVKEELQ
jgi:hypothetical protein